MARRECPLMLVSLLSLVSIAEVSAHGYLAWPPSKNAADMQSYKLPHSNYYGVSNWFVDKASFETKQQTPWTKPGHFSWKSARDLIPGHPQTFHPCGCYNPGNPRFCAGVELATGWGETTLGPLPENGGKGPKRDPPQWAKGSEQDTAWHIYANHAGGYLYMLCKKDKFEKCHADHLPNPVWQATRDQQDAYLKCVWDCFESNVVPFVPDSQKIMFEDKVDMFVNTHAQTKSAGTLPHGSVWRESPIADKLQVTSGGTGQCMWDAAANFSNDEVKAMFTRDFGNRDNCDDGPRAHDPNSWHIVDKVEVPQNLEPGEYLLSWRWECYKADQLWTNCADVQIVESGSNAEGGSQFPNSNDGSAQPDPQPETPTPAPTAATSYTCVDVVGDDIEAGQHGHKESLTVAFLPDSAGGGQITCDHYKRLSTGGWDFCAHANIKDACCFCGGGYQVQTTEPDKPEPEPENEPENSQCTNKPLSGNWGAAGRSCDTYTDAYCAHAEIKKNCCYCKSSLIQQEAHTWDTKKSGDAVIKKVPSGEDLDEEETMVETSAPVDETMPLCFKPLVRDTCRGFYDHGKHYKPAGELIEEMFDASEEAVDGFFEALQVGGDVKCRDLCVAALDYVQQNGYIVPETHDKGCKKSGGEWKCEQDMSPQHIADQDAVDLESTELPDHGKGVDILDDKGVASFVETKVGSIVARRAAVAQPEEQPDAITGIPKTRLSSLVALGKVVGDGPVKQTPEQMVLKILRIFRIYVSHPNDDEKIHDVEDASSLVSLNQTTRDEARDAIATSKGASMAWVSTILRELSSQNTAQFRQKWFGGSGPESEGAIRERLIKTFNFMDRELADMNYFYPADVASRSPCGPGSGTVAYVWKWGTNEKGYTETQGPQCNSFSEAQDKQCAVETSTGNYIVYLCKYWMDFGEVDRTATFIHEAAHHTGPSDVSYDVKTIQSMKQEDQLHNAANYQRFGEDVTLTKWGCANSAVVTGLPFRCSGGPCSCDPFKDYCNHAQHGATLREQCKATCGQCQAPASDGSTPRRRRATPPPTPAANPRRRRQPSGNPPSGGSSNCKDNAEQPCLHMKQFGYCENAQWRSWMESNCCATCELGGGSGGGSNGGSNGGSDGGSSDSRSMGCVTVTGDCTVSTQQCSGGQVQVQLKCDTGNPNRVSTARLTLPAKYETDISSCKQCSIESVN